MARRVKTRSRTGGSGRGRSLHALSALAAVVAAVLTAGCYAYVPARPEAVPPGTEVRIRVQKDVPLSVGAVPLPTDRNVVRGTLLSGPSDDTVRCSVLLQPWGAEMGRSGLRGTVSIPARAVQELEVRHLSKTRTGAVVALGVAVGWVLAAHTLDVHNAREGTDQGGGVDNALITLLRLHP